jgi:hypothetical protein
MRSVERFPMNQLGFPSEVTAKEIGREKSLGGAIGLCVKAAGFEPKQMQEALKTDKAQFSRWESNSEGIVWPKFSALMDLCGNDAPLLWMVCQRGYDLASLRRKETETARELRLAQEQIAQLQQERAVERRLLADLISGRVAA